MVGVLELVMFTVVKTPKTVLGFMISNAQNMDQLFNFASKNTREPCHELKTAKVTRVTNRRITIGYDDRHRAAPTAKQHSALAHDIGHIVRTYCPMQWKSWKAMSDEVRTKMNYNFDDINDDILTYIDMLLAEQYKQWKRDLHQYFETFDDLQKNAKANKSNREKKTLLHHSGLRPFSYKMEVRRQGGSKFSEIDIFSDVCVRPEHELVESLHALQPEHAQNFAPSTSEPVPNLKTFQSPPNDDPVDYAALFS
ncbi:hypothetical protein C1H46_009978 [Malus baccata]|uniref:Uncharacterized protein n=1 Tax=Malus baccata TaxID=106549 RepID=A0A540N031_MALBA|nr:hypothetical protein C1H46_009978 [Malus baccata]